MEELEDIQRNVETRGNGTQVFTEVYSEVGVGRLKNLVVTFQDQGEQKFYAILVDGEIVVAKTSNGGKFSGYLKFVNEHTKTVEVRMFHGSSPNCNKYQFHLNKGLPLAGNPQTIDVQTQIDKALEEQRLQNELKFLKEKLEKKNRKIKKLKKINEANDTGINKLKELVQGGVELAGVFGLGANKGLSGISQDTPQPESEVEVEIDGETVSNETTEEPSNQEILDILLEKYGEEGIKNVLGLITFISTNPELQQTINEEINKLKNDNDGQA